ncbi:MAG: PASTA domain-containing protein [Elusimicrobiaceae bacterium]|jgi:serine/threonine-protein kinase
MKEKLTDLSGRLVTAVKKGGDNFMSSGMSLWELAGIAFFLCLIIYFSLTWALKAVIHNRSEVAVPDITKKSAMAALDILSENGLSLKKQGDEFDPGVPAGSIVRQIPSPGTSVREGKTVRVWFSRGGEAVFAPNLVGFPLRNGELLVRQNQLMLGEVSESYSLRFEKGLIMSQDPKADASLSKNALVNVVVSAGEPPQGTNLMPDFRQKLLPEARRWGKDTGIEVKVSEDTNSVFPDNTVIGQEPAPDTLVQNGQSVNLTVSSKSGAAKPETANTHHIRYGIAAGGEQKKIKISLTDAGGEREVFNGFRMPGSEIDLTVPRNGPAMVRIFVNGILVDQREMP